jgi:hypothetical protein
LRYHSHQVAERRFLVPAIGTHPRRSRSICTEFLDDNLKPHQDQWSYLASVPKITTDHLRDLLAKSEDEELLPVRPDADSTPAPWRPPPMFHDRLHATQMPEAITASLADRLYVHRSQRPPVLGRAIKRLATFAKPEDRRGAPRPRVHRNLGVHNRAQLARALAGGESAA